MYSAFMYHSKHQYMCITSPLLIALFLNNDIAVSSAKLSVVASVKMSAVLTSATGGDEGGGCLMVFQSRGAAGNANLPLVPYITRELVHVDVLLAVRKGARTERSWCPVTSVSKLRFFTTFFAFKVCASLSSPIAAW